MGYKTRNIICMGRGFTSFDIFIQKAIHKWITIFCFMHLHDFISTQNIKLVQIFQKVSVTFELHRDKTNNVK